MATDLPTGSEQRPKFVKPTDKNRHPIRFCVVVLILLVGCEFSARLELANTHSFWSGVDTSNKPIDVLFIGSSRVAAAIDTQAFAEALPGPRPNVVNAGAGYTTAAEFHLALRNTFREHPDRLRNAVIFIEAPYGMPDSTTWSDRWSHPDSPETLIPLLHWEDVASYWNDVRGETLAVRMEERLRLTFDYTFRFSRLITYRLALGERFLGLVESPIKKSLTSFGHLNQNDARSEIGRAHV